MTSNSVQSKLPVFRVRQVDQYHCVLACLESVAHDLEMTWDQESIRETFRYECYVTREGDDNPSGQPPGTVTTRHIPALILGMGLAYQVRFGKGVDTLKSCLKILKKSDGFILLVTVDSPHDERFLLSCDIDGTADELEGHAVRIKKTNSSKLDVMDPNDTVCMQKELTWEYLEEVQVYVIAGWNKPVNAWPDKPKKS